jgi:chorismate mutase
MSQPTPAELFDHAQTLANGIRERDAAIKELLAERDQLKATVARVKALAEDMRTWCSPYGMAANYAQRIEEAIEPPKPDGIEADTEAEFAAKLGAILRKHRADVHPEHDEACANCAVIKGAPEILTAGLERSEVVPGPLVLREPTEAELARTKAALAEALDRNDLPAVRAFVADFDPRQEST